MAKSQTEPAARSRITGRRQISAGARTRSLADDAARAASARVEWSVVPAVRPGRLERAHVEGGCLGRMVRAGRSAVQRVPRTRAAGALIRSATCRSRKPTSAPITLGIPGSTTFPGYPARGCPKAEV